MSDHLFGHVPMTQRNHNLTILPTDTITHKPLSNGRSHAPFKGGSREAAFFFLPVRFLFNNNNNNNNNRKRLLSFLSIAETINEPR